MPDPSETWTESVSDLYRKLAAIAVPDRPVQIASLLTLFPFRKEESFRVVELASGEGRLAYAILSAFPNASLLALDVEETMRQETATRLQEFSERASLAPFDMHQPDWYDTMKGADVVISSLCIHHLDGDEKQVLFNAVHERLSPRGAFLIADLVLPKRAEANELFAAMWDQMAEAASIEQTLSRDLFQFFEQEHWNYYRHPDDFDKPSPLFEQLIWLKDAGFASVDCFWMQAGHAIYGGYMSTKSAGGISFNEALAAAEKALGS